MIYVLLIVIIVIFILSYLFTKDIFSPPCMICESYALAVVCAILNIKKWGIDLGGKTIFIILFGILLFVIPYIFFSLVTVRRNKKEIKDSNDNIQRNCVDEFKYVNFSKEICLILVFIQILFVISYLYFFSKSVGGISITNFSDQMSEYRKEISFDNSLEIPTIIKQLHKFFKGFIYLFTYIILHNMIVAKTKKEKRKVPLLFIISLLLFLIQSILSSGRAELVIYFIFALISYYLLFIHYFGLKAFNIKRLLKIVCIVLVALFAFSSIRTIFGRNNNDGLVDHVSRYFGGSIELLDLYLKDPIPKSNIIGKETFYNINQMLAKFGIGESYTVHLEFRQHNGIPLGNVYTAFRRMYQDFGLIGLIVLQLVFSIVTFLYYRRVRKEKDLSQIKIGIVFFGVLAHSLLLNSFSEFFYSSIISTNYILIFIYMIIIKFLLTKVKIKKVRNKDD